MLRFEPFVPGVGTLKVIWVGTRSERHLGDLVRTQTGAWCFRVGKTPEPLLSPEHLREIAAELDRLNR